MSEEETTHFEEAEAEPHVPEIQEPDYRELAFRVQAELENFRKRTDTERLQMIRFGNEALIEELLPVVDNFDRALKAVPSEQQSSAWVVGMNYIRKNLMDVLEGQGVTVLTANVGDPYDTTIQEALGTEPSKQPEDTVVSVVANGYRLHDRLLRPVQVTVSTNQL